MTTAIFELENLDVDNAKEVKLHIDFQHRGYRTGARHEARCLAALWTQRLVG